jgi:hypothetical protein
MSFFRTQRARALRASLCEDENCDPVSFLRLGYDPTAKMPRPIVYTVPNPPTNITGFAGNASVVLTWSAPVYTGHAPITSYIVTSNPGNIRRTSSTTRTTVTGLTNGTAYTFTIVAINSKGPSVASAASAAFTPITVATAPTGVSATPHDGYVTVTWTASSSDGGSAITEYVVTSTPGSLTASVDGTTLTADVTDLTNGTSYTFTVKAVNGAGNSVLSTATSSVTPHASLAGSLLFRSVNSSYLSTSPGFTFGTNAFTIETWFYSNRMTNMPIVGGSTTNCLSVFFLNSTTITCDKFNVDNISTYTVPAVSTGAWHHFAIVRNSSSVETVFVDGVKATSCSLRGTTSNTGGQQVNSMDYSAVSDQIGRYYGGFMDGNLTNYRVTIGATAYDPTAASITVPTSALTTNANVKYLMLGASITTDTAAVQTSITNNGGITQTSTIPF